MSGIREALESAAGALEGGGDEGGTEAAEPVHAGADSTGDAGPVGEVPEPASVDGDAAREPSSPEVVGTAAQRARDASGKFAKGGTPPKDTPAAKASAAVAVRPQPPISPAPGGIADPAAPVIPAPEAIKAPQSWKPAAREKWATLAPEAQQEIVRRERETATALQESAESRKVHQQYRETVAPYEGLIRAAGGEPMQMIGTLLQTGAQLRHGTPQTKAEVLAGVISEYGVPVELLAAALERRQGGQSQEPGQQPYAEPQRAEFRDPRIDQMLQQQQQRQFQKAHTDATAFASSHEFYEDVKHDMADLLETRGKRGVAMTLEAAYDAACKLHPEIAGVFEQRKAAEAAKAAMASTQRARAASTSIRPQPAGATAPQPKGIREQLAEAAAKVGR